jgi:hypothetical protein
MARYPTVTSALIVAIFHMYSTLFFPSEIRMWHMLMRGVRPVLHSATRLDEPVTVCQMTGRLTQKKHAFRSFFEALVSPVAINFPLYFESWRVNPASNSTGDTMTAANIDASRDSRLRHVDIFADR